MSNKSSFIEEKILPIASALAGNKYLIAIKDGLAINIPLIIAGSIFMIIASFPIDAWGAFLDNAGISTYLWKGVSSSFGLTGLVASFAIARSLAKNNGVDGVSAGVINLSAYITVTPFIKAEVGGSGFPVTYLGSKGLFVAIILALINASIFTWFIKNNIKITLPDSVPPAVAKSFSALIPGVVIISLWLIVYALIDLSAFEHIHQIIMAVLGKPLGFLGGSLFGTLIAVALNSLFWFCGIHGGSVVGSVMGPIWLMNTDANRLANEAGQALPNIITSPFMDNFVWMGGGGATLGLVIVLALIARSKKSSKITKTMAPLTLTPGIFNINEPAMFGIPIVMNVALLIPFIIVPMVNAVICYFAMSTGIVPLTIGASIPWTMPPILSGFLATGSIKGSILQAVCLVVDIVIYYVFYMMVEKQNLKDESGER